MLGLILNTSIRSILFQSDKEVVYIYENSINMCFPNSDTCAYSGTMLLANTGDKGSDRVTVTLANYSRDLSVNNTILNLNASKPRTHDPEINIIDLDLDRVVTIDNLAPGTLFKLTIQSGIPFNREQALATKTLSIKVESSGVVLSGDPQGAEMGRFLTTFL